MDLSEWIDEFRDMLRRRLGLILRVVLLGCVASFLFALSQTHQYTSMAVLQVQGAKVAGALAPPTVIGVDARELQTVEQRIMAHDAILTVAGRLGLLDDLGGLAESEKVALLRSSVRVSGVAAARGGETEDGALSLVRVSATWGNRESAQALAAAIAERTIAMLGDKRLDRAEETLTFFSLRERKLKEQLAELEETIAEFRETNDMPEAGPPAAQDREIEALRAEILSVEREMVVLERQIDRIGDTAGLTRLEQQQRADLLERLAGLTEQRDYLVRNLQEVSTASARTPEMQVQLTRYMREMEALRLELQDVSESRKAAEIGFQLEAEGQSERLSVLEPASWPDYPSTPSRTKTALLGAFASLLAAIGLAYLLDVMNPVVRSAAVMERELGFGPVVTIPEDRSIARRPGRLSRLTRLWRRRWPAA
ncbi:DUF874 domain-containing protein [Roseovarius amoyensis]|uniref:DUF874 domain-containing protein n=1 Tax=Roseovarius amoyensis TaxID=2211448 RepID=UPI000DBE02C7|nr:DUF874 domain-containing protein [Roseovarius amoyensis]